MACRNIGRRSTRCLLFSKVERGVTSSPLDRSDRWRGRMQRPRSPPDGSQLPANDLGVQALPSMNQEVVDGGRAVSLKQPKRLREQRWQECTTAPKRLEQCVVPTLGQQGICSDQHARRRFRIGKKERVSLRLTGWAAPSAVCGKGRALKKADWPRWVAFKV